ncbi:MAG: hypothetical protein JST01_16955 [Cyanobacteria bacterium SZAS TMP-1]|nr:hypothetical protein [Cyanobacteria bacterium SZAS TMP-1]
MKGYTSQFCIGEILVDAGLVAQSAVDDAAREAGTRARLLGRTLVQRGAISQENLRIAVEVQSLIRDSVVDRFSALKALSLAASMGLSLEQALAQVQAQTVRKEGSESGTKERTCRLGELLLEAGIVDESTLSEARAKGIVSGDPLGVVLVSDGILSESFLDAALELQVRVRDGMFSREQAISALQQDPRKLLAMIAPQMMADQAKAENATATIRLGELFVRAGIINHAAVTEALELSLAQGYQIAEVLVSCGFITQALLDSALLLQQMVTQKYLTIAEATACLAKVATTDKTVTACILELNALGAAPPADQSQSSMRLHVPGRAEMAAVETSTDLPAVVCESKRLGPAGGSTEVVESLEIRHVQPEEVPSEPAPEEYFGASFSYRKDDREELHLQLRGVYARLGRVFLKRRQLDTAEELLRSALDISSTTELSDKKLEDMMVLACHYLSSGQSWQSEALLRTCLSMLEGRPELDPKLLGLCHHRLALTYCHLGLLLKAERHLTVAVQQLNDIPVTPAGAPDAPTRRLLSAVYRDFAVLLTRLRREQEADRFYCLARKMMSLEHLSI